MFGPLAGLAGAKGRLENASGRAHVRAHTPCSSTKERKNCINRLLLQENSNLKITADRYKYYICIVSITPHHGSLIFCSKSETSINNQYF